jgi:predicted nucleic acid-binding protein
MLRSKFCWDACIFIAHLKGEQRAPEEMSGMREVWEMVRLRQATIVTSALVQSEVLNRAADAAQARDRLRELLMRPQFFVADANLAISDKAGEFRERVASSGTALVLKRNDAIYVATAVMYAVDTLHTFDPTLLALDGSPHIDGLRISIPRGTQTTLAI